jgi:hypothetical protein
VGKRGEQDHPVRLDRAQRGGKLRKARRSRLAGGNLLEHQAITLRATGGRAGEQQPAHPQDRAGSGRRPLEHREQ